MIIPFKLQVMARIIQNGFTCHPYQYSEYATCFCIFSAIKVYLHSVKYLFNLNQSLQQFIKLINGSISFVYLTLSLQISNQEINNFPFSEYFIQSLKIFNLNFNFFFSITKKLMVSQFPNHGLNPCLLKWEPRVLTTEPPRSVQLHEF